MAQTKVYNPTCYTFSKIFKLSINSGIVKIFDQTNTKKWNNKSIIYKLRYAQFKGKMFNEAEMSAKILESCLQWSFWAQRKA
jgi:hypothetical protein